MSVLTVAGWRMPRRMGRTRSWVVLSHTSWAASLTLLVLLAISARTGPTPYQRPFVSVDLRIVSDRLLELSVRPSQASGAEVAPDQPSAWRLLESPDRFALYSKEDSTYRSAVHPRTVHVEQPTGAARQDGPEVVTLELSAPLKRGCTYELFAADVEARFPLMLTFNEWRLQSRAIHVPQAGFRVRDEPKLVHIRADSGFDPDGYVRSAAHVVHSDTRRVVLNVPVRPDAESKSCLDVDISRLRSRGEYRVVVEGVGCSAPFRVW